MGYTEEQIWFAVIGERTAEAVVAEFRLTLATFEAWLDAAEEAAVGQSDDPDFAEAVRYERDGMMQELRAACMMAERVEITVEISDYRPTDYEVDEAVDADVTVTIDGVEYEGEITVKAAEDERSRSWGSWGDAAHWVSSDLLAAIPAEHLRAALTAIDGAVDGDECRAALREASRVVLPARRYEDHDDCLAAAAADVAAERGLEGWTLDARWGDDERHTIVVTLPR